MGSQQITIDMSAAVDTDLADELVKESAFVSPAIDRFAVSDDGAKAIVDVETDADLAEVEDKVRRFLDAMLANNRQGIAKTIGQTKRRDDGSLVQDAFSEFLQREWLFQIGPGHVAFAGPPLRLIRLVDALADDSYRTRFGAQERSFPAFVPATTLAACGYFDSHPNNVTMITHLIDDFDVIEGFRKNQGVDGDLSTLDASHLSRPHLCLNPAACLPCYPTLRDRHLDQEGLVLSWLGRVFRYESKNLVELERLWEFNVRELVFVGDEKMVTDARERSVEAVTDLAETLDLECSIQTATDPFFATVAAAKSFWQKSTEAKHEIRLTIAPGPDGRHRTTAAGSINMHGRFFGNRFSINAHDGDMAATACVGLGIERWVLAAFSQHGFEPDRWPEDIAKKIFD